MSAEGGNQEPKPNWNKVRLLKTHDGTLWYRTKTGEVVVLDENAEDEKSRQQNEPDTPPKDGYPEFSQRIGNEELPVTDPDEVDKLRADLQVFVNNIVDLDPESRTRILEELSTAEDSHDLEILRSAVEEGLAIDAAATTAGAAPAGTTIEQLYNEAKQKSKEKRAKKRAEQRAERDAIAELDAEEAAANPPKSLDDVYADSKDASRQRHAKKRAISKAERDAVAELDAEELVANPPPAPKTPDEVAADIKKAESERLMRRDIEERAKQKAKEEFDAAKAAESMAQEAVELTRVKDSYFARFENLRAHDIIEAPAAILAQDEIARAASSDELKAKFDAELRGLEKRLPETPEPDLGINKVADDAEFARLTHEAIQNIEAVIAVGGNPNSLYERYRKRLRAGDLKAFDTYLVRREAFLKTDYGITYGSMTPAERMRFKNPPPSFANKYVENGRIDRAWMAHDSEKYGDLVPFSMDEIRNDPKKKALYDRFMAAVEYDNTLKATVESGVALDDAQRQLLEYSLYEFTYQYKRAEVLSEMFTPEFTKKLMYQNTFVNTTAVMYGVEKTATFLKDDVFRLAMEDLGTFDRLALSAWRLNHLGSSRRYAQLRGDEHFEMANVIEERFRDPKMQAAMETEALTGTKAVENLPPPKEMSDEFSAANMQKYFDRDKMKATIDGRGWDKWTPKERTEYKRTWEPEEIVQKRKNKEAGFFAQMKAALMEALFGEQKKHVSAH